MRKTFQAALCILSFAAAPDIACAQSPDLLWEVENPFRFYKSPSSFALHENAFNALRGEPRNPPPADIVSRLERRLNDPDCRDASTPDTCAATRRARYEQSRLGWAAQTLGGTCYDRDARPRHYATVCERRYSWGAAKEDYILPDAHTVAIRLSPENLAQAQGECAWSWKPRSGSGQGGTRRQACKDRLVIARVPYLRDAAVSGVSVNVTLPDGRTLADPNVVVEDLFIVGLGDSFASGESNPDRPVSFSPSREMVYDPVMVREERMAKKPAAPTGYGLASAEEKFDPKTLPRRKLEDEERGNNLKLGSPEFVAAFEQRNAQWLSADCHRSQYGYPFRVGIELALENRHRAVTLVNLACTGAEVSEGLFLEKDAREGFSQKNGEKVPAQFDALSDLICRGGARGRSQAASYTLPVYKHGSTAIAPRTIAKSWCPPEARKRPIDMVLLSMGGNDVGFSALAAYAVTENAADLAPIVGWVGSEIRFGPAVSRAYLDVLDERMKAVKDALRDGFGVDPARVVHTAYEPIQFDETGGLCAQPTLGMDVHPKLKLGRERFAEASDFLRELLVRMDCISSTSRRPGCPANLATGAGTGFHFVTEHQASFNRRGICARDPARAAADGAGMAMPRLSRITDAFKPFSPAAALPYAHRWRLFRTPNDAFLIANTHREGISPFDILQPAYAGLYSGAFHPSAEAHAIVADYVMPYARAIVSKGTITVTPVSAK